MAQMFMTTVENVQLCTITISVSACAPHYNKVQNIDHTYHK